MTNVSVSKTINAPAATVMHAITDIASTPSWVPDVVKVEFLSQERAGVGTRFRETRLNRGREMTTDLEIIELEPHRVRMVTDSHGTVWDSVFETRPVGQATELTIGMQARPHRLMTRVLTPLMKKMFTRGMTAHLDVVARHCERSRT